MGIRDILERIREQQSNIYKVALFLASIAVIVYLFPKKAEFKYEFSKGEPWLYEDLIAPFEFAIRKSPETLKAERAQIRETVPPYYDHDNTVAGERIERFRKVLDQEWEKSSKSLDTESFSGADVAKGNRKARDSLLRRRHKKLGVKLLRSVYDKGIIKLAAPHQEEGESFRINVVRDNVVEKVPVRDLFTMKSAYVHCEDKAAKREGIDVEFLMNVLEQVLRPNVQFDQRKTEMVMRERLRNVSKTRGKVEKDVLIISKGDIVTESKYRKLLSLKKAYEEQIGGQKSFWVIKGGQALLVSLLMFGLFIFLVLFKQDLLEKPNKLLFLLFLIVLMTFLVKVANDTPVLSDYIVPFCILPIIIRAFYDTPLAMFVHFVAALTVSFLVPSPFEFALLQAISGIIVIYSIVNMRHRSQFFNSAAVIFISYSLVYFGIAITQEGSLGGLDLTNFAWFAGNALLSLLAYPLIYLFEKVFGFLSEMSLVELSDTNSPLLRELSGQAPGTFQHALQVADLAEEAVLEVEGDPLLIRAGALYHDIGKIDDPLYFNENQTTGVDMHEDLTPVESTEVIKRHVIKGIEKAKKYGLPDILIDFIRTHHGTMLVQFFYKKYLDELPEGQKALDENFFRYPGPLPYSKETAVLMMADSVEAASKSLKKYDARTIEDLVERIVNNQLKENQFINAPITLKDVTNVKKVLKRKLMNIYHVRVEYPEAD